MDRAIPPPCLSGAAMEHLTSSIHLDPFVGMGLRAMAARTAPLAHKTIGRKISGHQPAKLVCRSAQRGTGGAGKTIVTDYMFAGPGCATRKLVGRGQPQAPAPTRSVA